MPMPENGITVHHKGETFTLDLSEKEAGHFRTFVCYASVVPAEPPGQYPEERAAARNHMRESFTKDSTLGEICNQLAHLNQHDLTTVNALIAVINAGNSIAETGGNWICEAVTDLLENARDLKERHPRLFSAPPAEPEAVPESATPPARPRRHSARKARGKAA